MWLSVAWSGSRQPWMVSIRPTSLATPCGGSQAAAGAMCCRTIGVPPDMEVPAPYSYNQVPGLYTPETAMKMLPLFPTKGMFNMMRARHEHWKQKYPDMEQARSFPL